MNHFLYPICAAISLIVLLFKVRLLRADRSVPQLAIVGLFASLFLTYLVSSPLVWVATSKAVGIVNFSGLFTQGLVIVTNGFQQLLLLHLTHEPEVARRKLRPRLIALALVLLTMIVLFSAATSEHENPNDFALSKAQFYPAYLVVYLLAHIANETDVSIMCWRHAKVAPSPWLRRGLFINAWTLPLALIYSGCRLADVVAGQFGVSGTAWEPVAQLSVAASAIGRTIGWTLPDWGPSLSKLWQPVTDRRAYQKLEPLHRAVTDGVAVHGVSLSSETGLKARLYRRLVDIRDAQWELRRWMDTDLAVEAEQACGAAGLTGTDRAAVIEAAQLRFAIEAKKRGLEPSDRDSTPLATDPADLASELDFQLKLARAFDSSSVVRAILAERKFSAVPSKEPLL
ncbi:MAB_1171c family putative transporter [Streptomyces decoyicus]|uniref:MAB_1171c family putative transporter n=1 Tax=Streptomyces decoyicus TaxID=249567 RepID=UPI0038162DF8